MNAPMETPPAVVGGAGLISTETAAKLLMVSIEWIRRLTREGAIKKTAKDQYRVVDVVQGYITYLRDESRKTSKSAAASRVQDARAEEISLRLSEKRGTLLVEGQAEAINVIDEYAGGLRSDLMAVAAQVTNDLVLRRKIEDRIDGAFGAASKRAANAADRIEASRASVGAKGKAKSRRVVARKPRLSAEPRKARAA